MQPLRVNLNRRLLKLDFTNIVRYCCVVMRTDTTEIKYCLYARKSSESDERQAMSIDSQIKEMTALAIREGLNIVDIKQESHSAKQSSQRPLFNELINDLNADKFNAILTWAPDRLSRNAGDLGALVDLMDRQKLTTIRTFSQTFGNNPNEKFLLMILCSQAKLENDNRGINVKRGIRAKCEMGWRPGVAPIGYINRSFNGVKDIVPDPDRAPFVTEVFNKAAQGWSGRRIKEWADSAGFDNKSGIRVSLSQIFLMLNNTFYYGEFDYPDGSGKMYKGSHKPLVSKALFEQIQQAKVVPNTKTPWGTKQFAFKDIFKCGNCGASITAEEKFKPRVDGGLNRHVYYRCTKSAKDPDCKERSITANMITEQILAMVDNGDFDDIEPTEQLFNKIEHYKRVTGQLIKDYGIDASEKTHFRNYASYVLKQGTLNEQDGFIRGLNLPLFVSDKKIYRRKFID